MTVTMRRIIAIALVIAALVAVILIVRACSRPATPPLTIKSGQATRLGDIKWSVISVLKTRDVGPQDNKVTAKNWWLVVDLYLTNVGSEKVTLKPESFNLADSAKKTYSIDKTGTEAQVKGLSNPKVISIYSASIPSKAKQRVVMVFAIPETAAKLFLNVDGASVGADRDLKIDLGF